MEFNVDAKASLLLKLGAVQITKLAETNQKLAQRVTELENEERAVEVCDRLEKIGRLPVGDGTILERARELMKSADYQKLASERTEPIAYQIGSLASAEQRSSAPGRYPLDDLVEGLN
jgi:hypothetical protein